jgi:uncharacterized protein (DUF736 family)
MRLVEDSIQQITRLYYQASEMLLKELGCNKDNIHEFEIKQKIGFDQPREFWKNGQKAGEVFVETKISDNGITFTVIAQLTNTQQEAVWDQPKTEWIFDLSKLPK